MQSCLCKGTNTYVHKTWPCCFLEASLSRMLQGVLNTEIRKVMTRGGFIRGLDVYDQSNLMVPLVTPPGCLLYCSNPDVTACTAFRDIFLTRDTRRLITVGTKAKLMSSSPGRQGAISMPSTMPTVDWVLRLWRVEQGIGFWLC